MEFFHNCLFADAASGQFRKRKNIKDLIYNNMVDHSSIVKDVL